MADAEAPILIAAEAKADPPGLGPDGSEPSGLGPPPPLPPRSPVPEPEAQTPLEILVSAFHALQVPRQPDRGQPDGPAQRQLQDTRPHLLPRQTLFGVAVRRLWRQERRVYVP